MTAFSTFGKRPPGIGSGLGQDSRLQTSLDANVILATGKVVPCTIAKLSKTGAFLLVPNVLGLPARFELQDPSGRKRSVEVLRRGASRVEVRFL